jgi:hypothetical protein
VGGLKRMQDMQKLNIYVPHIMPYFRDLNFSQKYICCNNDSAGLLALDFAIKRDGVYVHTVAGTINKYGYDL